MNKQRTIRYVLTDSLHLHPKAYIIPDMRKEEWDDFYLDISTHDIKVPIEVSGDGTILDGRHRWKAAKQLGKKTVPIIDAPLNGEDPGEYMIKAALLRRHLTDDQRSAMAVLWAQENKKEPVAPPPGPGRGHTESNKAVALHPATAFPEPQEQVESSKPEKKEDKHKTRNKALKTYKIPRSKFDKAKKVLTENPVLFEQVLKGNIALKNASKQVKGVEERAKIENTKPPEGKYQVNVVDPPWPFSIRQDDPTHQIASPYETMTIEKIIEFPIPASDESILWLWVPNAFLHDAFHILEKWGFQYRTTLTWAKNFAGLGDWLGGQTEHCLMATKGNYKVSRTNQSTLLVAPRTKHSEKPDAFYKMVEDLCPGNKIDIFARKPRKGWETWGAELKNNADTKT